MLALFLNLLSSEGIDLLFMLDVYVHMVSQVSHT
jgi:hypothetical protein